MLNVIYGNILNKESQDILNQACKKIYKLFKSYYVLSYLYDDEEFDINLGFTEKSQKLLEKKDTYKRIIAEPLFEGLDTKLFLENSDVQNIIGPCVAQFEKFEYIDILTDKINDLENDFYKMTKTIEYYDLRSYSFNNLETSKIKNLGIINLFLDILPKADLEKYKSVVNFTNLKSSRNFRRYEKPILSKIFPKSYDFFFSVIINRLTHYLLTHYRSKVSNYAITSDQEVFQFSNKYKTVFETDENIKLINQYLATKKEPKINEYFLIGC